MEVFYQTAARGPAASREMSRSVVKGNKGKRLHSSAVPTLVESFNVDASYGLEPVRSVALVLFARFVACRSERCSWSNPVLGSARPIRYTERMTYPLPSSCERAILEQFLKAEAMALWAVRSAQAQDVPAAALKFLRRHEEEEAQHLKQFELLLGTSSHDKTALPRMPSQWRILAVHLYGYETLGLEFARLLVGLRPDLASILEDEKAHVAFFEREVRNILIQGGPAAQSTREAAKAWRRRLRRTVDRYLHDESLTPLRDRLRQRLLDAIDERFCAVGLMTGEAA